MKSGANTVNPQAFEDDVKLIQCADIDIPAIDKKARTFRKEFCQSLAVTIGDEGLHQPIGVRPKGSRYELVFGRHRLTAIKNILKWESIPARVRDLTDDECEQAKTAENLWRSELSAAQREIEIKKWYGLFQAKHPEKVGKGSAGGAAFAAKKAAEKTAAAEPPEPAIALAPGTNGASDSPTESAEAVDAKDGDLSPEESAPTTKSFPEMLAAVTGESVSSATRQTRIAKAFTDEELLCMEAAEVTQSDKLTIAKIKNEEHRHDVVKLVLGGLTLAEAIGNVCPDDAPTPDDGKSKATREAKKAAEAQAAPKLTDDEWFDANCSEKAALLTDPTKFRANAIFWRQISEARATFREKTKSPLKKAREGISENRKGDYLDQISKTTSMSHPKDWHLCSNCAAKGQVDGTQCRRCGGGCFLTKTEVYV